MRRDLCHLSDITPWSHPLLPLRLSVWGCCSFFSHPWIHALLKTLYWDGVENLIADVSRVFSWCFALIWGQSTVRRDEEVLSSLFGWDGTKVGCAPYSRGWIIDRGQRGSPLSVDVTRPPSFASLHTKLQVPAPYANDLHRPFTCCSNDPEYAT